MSSRAPTIVIAAFALCCAWFTGFFPPFSNPNELSRFQMVVAFVESGTFAIDRELEILGNHEDRAESGGRLYSNKAPGLAFAAIPVYRLLRFVLPRPESPTAPIFVLLRLLTVSLACVVALARFARRIRLRREHATVAALVTFAVAFGTPLLNYATSFFAHAWTAALLFLAWDALRPTAEGAREGTSRRIPRPLVAGFLAGWAVISEYTVAPVAVALAARVAFGPPPAGKGRFRTVLLFAAGAAVPLALLLGYQAACFGSPFLPSYAREAYPAYAELAARRFFGFTLPSPKIAFDYLFHPARGILLFSPFFLWAAPGFVRWWRARDERADCAFAFAGTAATFLLLTGYPNWHGGWAVGSRYLLPLAFLPAAALPFALRGALSRGLFGAAAAYGAGVHVLAAFSWASLPTDFAFPQATGTAWFLARGWVAPNLGTLAGLPSALSLLLPAAAAVIALFFALRAARPLVPPGPVAALLGAAPLVVLLARPPGIPYSSRLLRAAIYGDYSGRDPARAELAKAVSEASTPLERAQAELAWKTSGPR